MALSAGARIGAYEILAKVGQGGMGEVYRARDMTLGRDVALKFVSDAFASDLDRVARFEREARTLASLNHPHIANIYGFQDSDGKRALVMEFVDGVDLSSRIARGPVAVDEALPIARQIADALQAAHDADIVHRDLKPANIKLRADGTVKVLDFGLAKAKDGAGGSGTSSAGDVLNSPTITTPAMTAAGLILGTAAYMSPEQAKGRPVDQRADIWAFGCVLYEMLTGKRAFEGEDVSDTLAALVAKEPDWSRLPPATPSSIRRLLRRCLTKDVNERLHSIGDARLEIVDALTRTNDDPFAADPHQPHGARRVSTWAITAAAAAALVLAGVLGWAIGRRQPAATATSASSPIRLSFVPSNADALAMSGNDRDLAISPDGHRIAYVGGYGTAIVVRDLQRQEAVRIERAGLPHNPFFSPDGTWVGFTDGLSAIKKVPAAGGAIETICRIMNPGVAAAWHGDTIVFGQSGRLYRVAATGGIPEAVTPPPGPSQASLFAPTFLPGGAAVLAGAGRTATTEAGIVVVDLRSGAQKLVVPLGQSPGATNGLTARFVEPGHLVYRAARQAGAQSAFGLRVVDFDLQRMETSGAPTVLEEPIYITDFGGYANFDIAENGTLVYLPIAAQPDSRRPVWVYRDGREEPIDLPPRAYTYPNVSPDGQQVAFDIRDQENDTWIWDIQRHTLRRLTFDPGFNQYAVWTHDQRRVAYFYGTIRWQAPDGRGQSEELANIGSLAALYAFSRDDRHLVFRQDFPETGHDLMVLSLEDRKVAPLLQTRFNELNADLSPDGRWIAYESDESGTPSIYVRPFPNVDAGRWQVSTTGARAPRWSRDGKELFFLALDGTMMVAPVEAAATAFVSHAATPLFAHHNFVGAASSIGRTYDVSPDGSRILMFKPAPPPHISVVLNWAQTLSDRVK